MSKFAYVTGVLMLMASPAIAQTPPATPANADARSSDADRLVCKKEEGIGSRLAAKKICLTVHEWQARSEADREQLEKIQSETRAPRSG